jgi:hypothetical protein
MRQILALTVVAVLGCLSLQVHAQSPNIASNYQVLGMFVKNALTALNHGNLTGNYTVLRDLGSPAFREKNTPADLALIFAEHRKQKYDLSPILVSEPQFTEQPIETKPGRLKLVGFFPTQPQAVRFAIVYQRTEKGWGIDEVSVAMMPVAAIQQTVAPEPVTQVQYQQP